MATTFEDRNGKVFNNREDAKKSNQNMTGGGSTNVTKKPSKAITDLSIGLADEFYKKNPKAAIAGGYKGKLLTAPKKGPSTALRNMSINLAKGNITGTSALNANTTQGSLDTSKGKPLGSGTPLNDAEINALEKQGFREGDFVPGRGTLLPDGTFNTKGLTMASDLRAKEDTTAKGAMSSDTPIVQKEKTAADAVTSAATTSPTSTALTLLDEEMRRIKDDLRSSERTINSNYDSGKTALENKQAQETGSTSVKLADAGGYLGFSGGAQGVLLSLAGSHRAELADLDSKRQQLIQQARDASANRRFDVVRLKADELQRLDQDVADKQEKYNAEVKKVNDAEKVKADNLKIQNDISTAITGGAKTPQDIFKKLNGAVDIKDINNFLTGISKNSTGSFKFSANETANLLGTGMSADDVSALNDYVNENGYDEKVRSALTPSQRLAADKIYGLKSGKTTNGGGVAFVTKEGVPVSNLTSQVLDGFTKLSALTPTMEAKVKSELFALGFGDSKTPGWFDEATAMELLGADATDGGQQNLIDYYAMNNLADYGGPKKNTRPKSLNTLWNQFRNSVLSNDEVTSSSAASGGIPTDVNDL